MKFINYPVSPLHTLKINWAILPAW